MKIVEPTLLLDIQKCKSNIEKMCRKAKENDLLFRPHFKTHQSLEIGRWFKDHGVKQITVSSLNMAMYFMSEWQDITVAFPTNILEIDKINNIYTGSLGYTYIKRPVDPSYWIYQFHKLMGYSDPDTRWIIVNHDRWEMPKEWAQHGNVFQETYDGMAKFINKQLTKSK